MTHPSLRDRIEEGNTLLADGGMGTMLFSRGLAMGECPERVNLDHPDWLVEIAREYAEAGADIVHTNSFGGSPLKLAQYDLDDRCEEINAAAVRAAREGAGQECFVSLSCGPTGRLLAPLGDVEPDVVRDGFIRQIGSAVEAGIDMITIETMTDPAEAVLAIEAARSVDVDIPVAATMTFDVTPEGIFTIMGTTVAQAAQILRDAGADIVGSNCGNGIENMILIAAAYREVTDSPLLIQSNAGLPELKDGDLVYAESPEFMAEHCRRLLELNVNIIGGCCGTTPEHIKAVRGIL